MEICNATTEREAPCLSQDLFEKAMRGQWTEVVEIYKKDEESRVAVLTASRDTALHLAVSGGRAKEVKQMVESLGDKVSEILWLKNDKGNTALHTVAELGDAYMCKRIASKVPDLITNCNEQNATPLFLAALFGHQEAFLCLHFLCKVNPLDAGSRKPNGDTFLHVALQGEFFSLAFQIVRKYPELAKDRNEDGFTPLHILATKPNAFKSITVKEVKEIKNDPEAYLKRFDGSKEPWYPENYGTCAHFFHMLFGVVFYGLPSLQNIRSTKVSGFQADEEKGRNNNHDKGESKDEEEEKYNLKQRYVPPNYASIILSLKFFLDLLLIVLGHGFHRIKKIIIKKERHTVALQVMNELVKTACPYKFSGRETDIHFDPRITGKAQGVEAETDKKKGTCLQQHQHANLGQKSLSAGTQHNEGFSNKEGTVTVAPMESFLKEYRIIGSVDSKSSKYSVKMAFEKNVIHKQKETETPFLIAAKMGITEMVESILDKFPVSIQDLDADGKNVLLLAVENRQTHTFQFLINRETPLHESIFRKWDHQGNNALHLAAKYGEYRPWLIPGSALQMQWELKWYKFVKRSISKHLPIHYKYNKKNQTPKQIFTETHKLLVKDGSAWLTKTSESCSLVAALIATVAFATSATIPGGVKETSGTPVLADEPAFSVFCIASLVALCFSVTALVFFLAILTSRFEEKDFACKLPWRLIIGLTALFTSITAILVSFCAGHFFELKDRLKFAALPIYIVTCLPVSFFALPQLSLYFDLLRAIIKDIPQRSYNEFTQ
ncbi:ankyrin repeat-containing protein [Gossypium australe]|uniref:Ankyrin repeat-containing protein n=1 Tax=Gossypium australe TaxID=47621 RepID=A0A5B6WGN3_9ROSI|nr:ankyrin repeat-containing protein [Gossypium australe]